MKKIREKILDVKDFIFRQYYVLGSVLGYRFLIRNQYHPWSNDDFSIFSIRFCKMRSRNELKIEAIGLSFVILKSK